MGAFFPGELDMGTRIETLRDGDFEHSLSTTIRDEEEVWLTMVEVISSTSKEDPYLSCDEIISKADRITAAWKERFRKQPPPDHNDTLTGVGRKGLEP